MGAHVSVKHSKRIVQADANDGKVTVAPKLIPLFTKDASADCATYLVLDLLVLRLVLSVRIGGGIFVGLKKGRPPVEQILVVAIHDGSAEPGEPGIREGDFVVLSVVDLAPARHGERSPQGTTGGVISRKAFRFQNGAPGAVRLARCRGRSAESCNDEHGCQCRPQSGQVRETPGCDA